MPHKKSHRQMKAIHAKKRAKKHKKNGLPKGAYFGADYFKGKAPAGNGEAKGFYQGNESVL